MNPHDSQGSEIAADVKAQLKDPSRLFGLLIRFQVREGTQQKFEATFAKAITATRKEQGVVAYQLNRDTKDATCYFLNERWKNLPALEAHLNAPYIVNLLGELTPMLSVAPELRVLIPAGE